MKLTAVEWLRKELETIPNYSAFYTNNYQWVDSIINEAKEMEKEQKGYSEEDVRLAYFQGEKDSYVKGGQTKKMEDEFIESLKQKKNKNNATKRKSTRVS